MSFLVHFSGLKQDAGYVHSSLKSRDDRSAAVKACDATIRWGLVFLMGFTPLVFGAVQSWAYKTMEVMVLFLVVIWGVKILCLGELSFPCLNFLVPIVLFLVFIILQLLPLPKDLLSFVSPSTSKLFAWTSIDHGNMWRALSVYPYATATELSKWMAYLGVFLLVVNNIATRKELRFLIWTLVTIGFVLSVFAIVQKLAWNGMAYWFIPLQSRRLPFGPYINKNHFAGYVEMIILLTIALAISGKTSAWRHQGMDRRKHVLQSEMPDPSRMFTLFFMAGVMSCALFFSLSRGGMVSFVVSLAVLTALLRWKRRYLGIGSYGTLALAAALLLVVWIGYGEVSRRVSALLLAAEGSVPLGRMSVWREAWPIFRDFPVWGTGLGTFANVFPMYQLSNGVVRYLYPENDYLQLLLENGTVGALFVVAAVAMFTVYVLKRFAVQPKGRSNLLAAGALASGVALSVHSLVDFNLHIPANALHFALVMGLLVVSVNLRGTEREPRFLLDFWRVPLSGSNSRRLAGVLLAVSALFLGTLVIFQTDTAANLGAVGGRAFQRTLDDWGKHPAEAAHYGERAVEDYRAAVTLDPLNMKYHYRLGWTKGTLQLLTGTSAKRNGYKTSFQIALRLYPKSPQLRYAVGMFYFLNWDLLQEKERQFGVKTFREALTLLSTSNDRERMQEKAKYRLTSGNNKLPSERLLELLKE